MSTAAKLAAAQKAKTTKKAPTAQKSSTSGAPRSIEAAPRASAPKESPLNEKQAAFVREYLIDLNACQAAIRAGYSPNSAQEQSSRLLSNAKVSTFVEKALAERAKRTEITADRVVKEAWAIMTADPRELVEHRVGCCRYCWGTGNRYQRTAAEMLRDENAYSAAAEKAIEDGKPIGDFDTLGGTGYNRLREPNPDCPECFGEGIGRVVLKDTSKISTAAASLFAGIKESDKGLEIKFHSKDAAMDKMFRHLGLYKDKIELTMPTVRVKDFTGKK